MKIIRGAIDIKSNTAVDIDRGIEELISEIIKNNDIEISDITGMFFSATDDLDAAYPARTARKMGIISAALMCFQEMKVKGSLEKCIRVSVFVDKDIEINNIYLGKADSLCPKNIYQIAVDGPAGSGKSTVSKIVADRLGIIYIDTGAMYRAITYAALKEGLDVNNEELISNFSEKQIIDFKNKSIFLNGKNVDKEIRENIVSRNVSVVSSYKAVRKRLVNLQRELSMEKSVIMDGRDIGTVVFPNAKYKIYLDASPECRGKRRYLELKEKNSNADLQKTIEEIKERDNFDSNREISPLRMAEDAFYIDTEPLTLNEVVEKILDLVK